MAETQSGLALVWAVQGIAFTAGIVSATNAQKIQSLSMAYDGEKVYVKSDAGETVGRVDVDGKLTLTINVIPCHATSKASANASFHASILAPGTVVKMTDSTGTATLIEGAEVAKGWLVNRSTANKTNTGVAVIELELERFYGTDVTSTVSA